MPLNALTLMRASPRKRPGKRRRSCTVSSFVTPNGTERTMPSLPSFST
jgi:hypothetical protein